MRISNRNLIMNQLRNMTTTLGNFTNSNNRMTSGRKFDHAYENVADATRAMRLRKSIRDKEFYISNIRDARGRLNSAEDAIQTTVNILRSVTDRVEEALNGTVPEEDRKKIATEISNLQEEVLALMNTTYTDHPVFSGSGYDKKNVAPFQTQGNKLLYHGQNVDYLTYDKKTGTYMKPSNYQDFDRQVTKDGSLQYEEIKTGTNTTIKVPLYELRDKDNPKIEKTYAQAYYYKDPADNTSDKILIFDADGKPVITPIKDDKGTQLTEITPYDKDGKPITGNDGNPIKVEPEYDIAGTEVSAFDKSDNLLYWPVGYKDGTNIKVLTKEEYEGNPTEYGKGKIELYKLEYAQETKPTSTKELDYSTQNYLDIGIGHTFKENKDGTMSINPETVHQFTYSGIEVFGAGKTNGHANNVYTFMGEIVDCMNNGYMDLLGEKLDHIKVVRENLLTSLTEIGVRTNFLDNMEDIHKNDLLNFQTRQKDVEAVDLPQEAMNNKNHEMAWMVTLQMGSKVLPSSLFDFLR